MSLSEGDNLGHYRVLGPLGAGGMGEVYRARDTQLERDVAIKVLPRALANDPERLARFDREAKILAALNHPNIAVIYGLVESGGGRALVMELVPGETLGDRVKRGALPLDEALPVARQMAEALEAAHDKGVVHRDLKPGNVMITPAGLVKVLDFGLAAIVSSAPRQAGDPENSPTLTMGMTQAGAIMGTAAYMSPEQAAGTPVDKRADIWSYGVVLWEMLTGQRLFTGDTMAHTLAAVLQTPIDFERLTAPQPIQHLLRRCLDRDVKTRLRDIGEARVAITSPTWSGLQPATEASASAPAPAPSRLAKLWPAVAALFALAAATVSILHFRETPPEPRPISTTLLPPENAEFDFSLTAAMPALSPDGTRIVFGAKSKDGKTQLWVRRLDSPTAQPLPGTEGAATPFWSPDSRWVGFGQENKLKKIDVQGGPPVPIVDLPAAFRGGSWSPQGVIVFGVNNQGPILRVAAAGGTVTPATSVEKGRTGTTHRNPWFLPDGRHFLYTGSEAGDMPVRVGSLDDPGKPAKVVAQAHSTAAYSQGHLLYLRENTLMAQPFDVNQLETTGELVPIAEGVPTFGTPQRRAGFAVSANGLLVYLTGASRGQSRLVWKDRQGKALSDLGEPTGQIGGLALSPDGKRVATSISDRSGNDDLWIYDAARSIPTRFTFDPASENDPAWSPDGNSIYFRSRHQATYDLFRKASNGAGTEELLIEDSANKTPDSVSADGKLLLYTRFGEKTGPDLWVLPLMQGSRKAEPHVFLQTPFDERRGQFSPDGQWVAYQSNESGQFQVYAAPFPGPGGKRQISSGGGIGPLWRRDGKEIFYAAPGGQLMAAQVAARNGTLEVGRVQKLFDVNATAGGGITYDVSADGQKFLVVDDGVSSARPLTLLQNWTAALRK